MKGQILNCLIIIPARGGSKGIKNKNLQLVGGKSLVRLALESANEIAKDDDICILSSDSTEILAESDGLKNISLHNRSKRLSADKAAIPDLIEEILLSFEKENITFKWILILQPTAPFRTPRHIKDAMAIGNKEFQGIDGVISVTRDQSIHPYLIQKSVNGFLKPFIDRGNETDIIQRQALKPECLIRNGAIYLVKYKSFKRNKSLKFGRFLPYVMSRSDSLSIDDSLDLMFANFLANV